MGLSMNKVCCSRTDGDRVGLTRLNLLDLELVTTQHGWGAITSPAEVTVKHTYIQQVWCKVDENKNIPRIITRQSDSSWS